MDTLETQVLQRIDNGTAGVMEVEAVLEFLAQALEAMDSVDTRGVDQVPLSLSLSLTHTHTLRRVR